VSKTLDKELKTLGKIFTERNTRQTPLNIFILGKELPVGKFE
jgi:hypothetical protein